MIRNLLFFISLFFISMGAIKAQGVPNNGMENWSSVFGQYDDPDGWQTLNVLKIQGKATSVFKSTDSHLGTYAAKIVSVDISGANPAASQFPDTAGVMFAGAVDMSTYEIKGFAISERHSELQFHFKYNPTAMDQANVGLSFTKWDITTSTRIIVATADVNLSATATYTQQVMPLTYLNDVLVPDTALMYVSASSLSNPELGSELFVDNFLFSGITPTTVGIEKQNKNSGISLYPNPANDQITIQRESDIPQNIQFLNITGQVITETTLAHKQTQVNTGSYAPGIYFYRIMGEDKEILGTGKFVVSR